MELISEPLFREDLDHILARTEKLWEEARGARFFITGGTGFFGTWLLESLVHVNDSLGLGLSATVLSRDPATFAQKAPHLVTRRDLSFIQGDVRSFEFPSGSFDFVVHAATDASARLNAENPRAMFETAVQGTRRVLDFASQCEARKFLLTSSGAVYGRQPSDVTHLTEAHSGGPDPLAPESAYAEGKRVAEFLGAVSARETGMEVKIARSFAFLGPHLPLDTHFAVGNFLRDALNGEDLCIEGDGTPFRSYLYAADLTIWLWTILFRGVSGRAYNVGSAESLSIAQVARRVAAAFEPSPSVRIARRDVPYDPFEALPPRDFRVARYVPDVTRAREELGLEAWIGLDEAIRRTRDWHLRSRSRSLSDS